VRRAIWLLWAVWLAWSVTACIPAKLKEAKRGLAATIDGLPESAEFTIVASLSGEDYDTYDEVTCYSAVASIAVGTFLPKEEALAAYVQQLRAQEWAMWDDEYDTEKVLIQGEHATISVSSDSPGWRMKENEDYKRAREIYPTFLRVSVQYHLPSRKDCLGE